MGILDRLRPHREDYATGTITLRSYRALHHKAHTTPYRLRKAQKRGFTGGRMRFWSTWQPD